MSDDKYRRPNKTQSKRNKSTTHRNPGIVEGFGSGAGGRALSHVIVQILQLSIAHRIGNAHREVGRIGWIDEAVVEIVEGGQAFLEMNQIEHFLIH